MVPPADGHNTTGQVIPSVHGNGPIDVSVYGFPTELDSRIIDTSRQLGGDFKFNEDVNQGDTLGIGTLGYICIYIFFMGFSIKLVIAYTQSTIGHSRRSSSAVAYLDPILSRENLFVLINTQATKLILSVEGGTMRGPAFKTVEIAQGPGGE